MAYTAIDDPSAHFQTAIYTGSTSSVTVTNDGNSDLQPDWIWIKRRNGTNDHNLFDSSRGFTQRTWSNQTSAENTDDGSGVSANSDGFATGTYWGDVNSDGNTFVGWQWKANGGTKTTVTASGDVQASTYQPNTTAGFSILTWTGTGENKQITHGLGKQADWIMVKNRDQGDNWAVWSYARANQSASASFILNTNAASSATPNPFDGNLGTASIFWINGGDHEVNADTEKYVAYAWTDIQGYSKFGLYTGNNNADGPFVYTGFKPAFVLFKAIAGTENWGIFDNKRNTTPGNPRDIYLLPSVANADSSESDSVDFLSNGFKWRIASGFRNGDGVEFIYMAFAEQPFVTSGGVPCTAS